MSFLNILNISPSANVFVWLLLNANDLEPLGYLHLQPIALLEYLGKCICCT